MDYAAYERLGYPNRKAYLKGLAQDYGLPLSVVLTLADLLGPNEDFDGLITELGDIESMGDYD